MVSWHFLQRIPSGVMKSVRVKIWQKSNRRKKPTQNIYSLIRYEVIRKEVARVAMKTRNSRFAITRMGREGGGGLYTGYHTYCVQALNISTSHDHIEENGNELNSLHRYKAIVHSHI